MREQAYLEFVSNPRCLEEIFAASRPATILIDEIQRLPSLLNTIQVLLVKKTMTQGLFLLVRAHANCGAELQTYSQVVF
jgi:hypothetical protein